MLLAGHETTSTSTTWCLWELAKPHNREVQEKLRAEVTKVAGSQPTMEELNALPYLDAVVKENMRVNGPADATVRSPAFETVIPLSSPYTDRHGVQHTELK